MSDEAIRNYISSNENDDTTYKAEKERYHLYACGGCPFANMATIVLALKGLEDVISVSLVDPVFDAETGWRFTPDISGCTDNVCGKIFLKDVYEMSHPEYQGVTSLGYSKQTKIPVLFDKQTKKIVNNDFIDIMKMLNTQFNKFSPSEKHALINIYPEDKQNDIDKMNQWINDDIIMGVYKCGSAKLQEDYDRHVNKLFDSLDRVEDILSKSRYLTGNTITLVDICLFSCLVRFDSCYYTLFKCSKQMISWYKNIWGYTRDIYQTGTIKNMIHFDHIKSLYWLNKTRNPSLILPVSPCIDFSQPSQREEQLK